MTMNGNGDSGKRPAKARRHEQHERTRRACGQAESSRPFSSSQRSAVPARPARKLRLPAYVRHG